MPPALPPVPADVRGLALGELGMMLPEEEMSNVQLEYHVRARPCATLFPELLCSRADSSCSARGRALWAKQEKPNGKSSALGRQAGALSLGAWRCCVLASRSELQLFLAGPAAQLMLRLLRPLQWTPGGAGAHEVLMSFLGDRLQVRGRAL